MLPLGPLVALLVPGREFKHDVLLLGLEREGFAVAVGRGRLGVEEAPGDAEHQPVRAPVGDIDEGIEVAVHQGRGVALEVAPVVRIGEARRRDLGPRGQGPQLTHLLLAEGAVDRAELVILIFAHGGTSGVSRKPRVQGRRIRGVSRGLNSTPAYPKTKCSDLSPSQGTFTCVLSSPAARSKGLCARFWKRIRTSVSPSVTVAVASTKSRNRWRDFADSYPLPTRTARRR